MRISVVVSVFVGENAIGISKKTSFDFLPASLPFLFFWLLVKWHSSWSRQTTLYTRTHKNQRRKWRGKNGYARPAGTAFHLSTFVFYLFWVFDFCLYRNRYMVAKQWWQSYPQGSVDVHFSSSSYGRFCVFALSVCLVLCRNKKKMNSGRCAEFSLIEFLGVIWHMGLINYGKISIIDLISAMFGIGLNRLYFIHRD